MLNKLRIGNGFDVHKFVKNRNLILGGVHIDHPFGLEGHSDADVLTHAIMDALLSSASLPDIGILFPNNDTKFKDINSIHLLEKVYSLCKDKNISIINIDSTIICEKPKISPYIDNMKTNISKALNNLTKDRIGIKGTTTEKLGFPGRGEGIAVISNALIAYE